MHLILDLAWFNLALLTIVSVIDLGTQAPIQSQEGSAATAIVESSETPPLEVPLTSCPGYIRGNPNNRNKTGCLTGTNLESVDHEMAFGFNSGRNPDWSACDLPRLPEANQKICYRTTVDRCGNDYRIYLNLRNLTGIQRKCPHESEIIPTTESDGSDRLFQSPRYGCRKGRGSGNLYGYQRSDLCLNNISIPNCDSGSLLIESSSGNDHEIEGRVRDENGHFICSDYLQFFYGTSKTERYCANDLTLKLPLVIPATRLMAVFWTDPAINDLGFNLRASCLPNN